MAYTTGSTFSLQTGYNIPTFIYPANGLTSGTRSNGIVAPTDPYTSNATSSFFTDISNKTNGTLSVEQLAYIVENDPTLLTSISANVPIVYTQSTDTIGKMIISKIIKNTTKVYGVHVFTPPWFLLVHIPT